MAGTHSDNEDDMGGLVDQTLYIEKLASLKSLRDGQYSLQCVRSQVECCYGDYCECHQLVERCGRELDKLELERTQLLSRLEQIDKDKKKLSEIKEELSRECSEQLYSAPTADYDQIRQSVNLERRVFGMEPLLECQANTRIQTLLPQEPKHSLQCQKRRKLSMQQRDHLKSHVRERAGPSFKQCPHCDAVVSRNAVMCTNCKAPCSKPGHSNGKKR